MIMETKVLKCFGALCCSLWLCASNASATLYTQSTSQTITDGSSVGVTSTINVTGVGGTASSGDNVSVVLNLSGGNIGDLIAYLTFSGTTVQLMNRPGVTIGNPLGYTGNSSFVFSPVTLVDGSYTSVDSYGGGSITTATSFNPTSGSMGFQAFNGLSSAAGNWTLFFADMSGGDGANVTTLNSWSLDITAVPEPINAALGIFAGVVLFAWILKFSSRKSAARL